MNTLKIVGLVIISCLLGYMAGAQDKRVQGIVNDDKGRVAGVSITQKDMPGNGTATDEDGRFTITLKGSGNVLVFQSVGYQKKEVNAGAGNNITITMVREDRFMEDVVVIGYGKQKKITVTGAASEVSGRELRQNPSASLQNTLAGRLTGFSSQQRSGRPGADGATFFIRGQSSFNNPDVTNQPLIIVDDIEFTYDQFARLDANELESVTILKDASMTAVYGIKGANGVVVVTTRRGKAGKPKISLRSEYSLSQPTILPKYVDSYTAASLYNQAQINDNAAAPNPTFKVRFTDQDLELFKNGKDPYGHPNVNWKDELFRDVIPQTRINMDIAGGTDKAKYFISLGYIDQDGITKDFSKGQGYSGNYYNRRFNYRSNLDIAVNKTLGLRLDLSGNRSEINVPSIFIPSTNGNNNDVFYEYSSFLSLAPFAYPVKNPDGSWGYSNWQKNEAGGGNYNGNNIIERLSLFGYNRNYENNMNVVTSATQKLDFLTPGLAMKGTLSYASSHFYSRGLNRTQAPSFIYDINANTYTPRDVNLYRLAPLGLSSDPGQTIRNLNLQANLTYDRNFGPHHVYGLALFNQTSVTRQILSNGVPDPTYNYIPANTRGFTARFGYDFQQKYLFQISGAYNGSDRFVASKRFGFFPAASAGWNIAEENFFKNNISFLSQFKVRASYGLVGSDNIGSFKYAYLQTYSIANGLPSNSGGAALPQASFGYNNNQYNAIQEGSLPNKDVTWEKERKFDLGLDFALFNGKLTGTLDYFNNLRYDILTTRGTISAIFGQDLPPVNLGRVRNKGYEVELNYRNTIGKNFTYSVKGIFSVSKNKILFQDEPSVQYPYQAFTGNSIGQQMLYVWTGTFYQDAADIARSPKTIIAARPGDLKYADLNGDNLIDGKDRAVAGMSNYPNTNYGFQFSVGYKNITLSALFQAATNFSLNAQGEAIKAFSSNIMEIHTEAWTPALGDKAKYPALTLAQGLSDPTGFMSTFWHIPGDYLRLRTAEINFSLPDRWMRKIHMDAARIYVNGNNLFTWSKAFKLYALDPEVAAYSTRTNYPPMRTFNAGINVTF